MDVISSYPLIGVLDNFLSDEECDALCESNLEFKRSLGFDFDENLSVESEYRTSSTCILQSDDYIRQRACRLFSCYFDQFIDVGNFEYPQIQRYNAGEYYKSHNDFFNYPHNQKIDNDRIASIIVYLNDDFKQGETEFPLLEKIVKPKKGSALFFKYNYDYDTNNRTFHSGLPVSLGTKFIITLWIRKNKWP